MIFYYKARRIATLHVDRAPLIGHPENQATRPVFVVWVVLDDDAVTNRFPQFLDVDMPDDALVHGMAGELELFGSNFLANLV